MFGSVYIKPCKSVARESRSLVAYSKEDDTKNPFLADKNVLHLDCSGYMGMYT